MRSTKGKLVMDMYFIYTFLGKVYWLFLIEASRLEICIINDECMMNPKAFSFSFAIKSFFSMLSTVSETDETFDSIEFV